MHELDRLQVDIVEVQPVGDHQLDVVAPARLDHLLALADGDCHRLLAEHVHPDTRGADGVFLVHGVRQGDVDRIDVAKTLFVLLVGIRVLDVVFPRQRLEFRRVVADERGQS
jgi:hypothetical protein